MAFIKTITSTFFDTDEMKNLNSNGIFHSFNDAEKGIYLVNQFVCVKYILSYKEHCCLCDYNKTMLDKYADKDTLSNNPLINDYIYDLNVMCESWLKIADHKNPMIAKAIDIINWLRGTTKFSSYIKYNEFIYFLTKPEEINHNIQFLYAFKNIQVAMSIATSLYAIEKYDHLYGELNLPPEELDELILRDTDNNTFNLLNFPIYLPYPKIDLKTRTISLENSIDLRSIYQINYKNIRDKQLNKTPLLLSILKNIEFHNDNNDISIILLILSYFCLSKNIYTAAKSDTEFFLYTVRSYVEGDSRTYSSVAGTTPPSSLPMNYIDFFKTMVSNGLVISTTNGIDYPTYLKTNFNFQSGVIIDIFYSDSNKEEIQISVAPSAEVSVETFNLLTRSNNLFNTVIKMADEENTEEEDVKEETTTEDDVSETEEDDSTDNLDFSDSDENEDSDYGDSSSSEVDAKLPNTNANTNSKKGIKIELDQNPSLDSVMFKREILDYIDNLLIDDKLEPVQVNSLKNIKTKWLGLLSTTSVIDLVETVLRRTIIKRN